MFCLRGGKELRELKFSLVARHIEIPIDMNIRSFKKHHVNNKVVSLFPCPEAGSQCLYMS